MLIHLEAGRQRYDVSQRYAGQQRSSLNDKALHVKWTQSVHEAAAAAAAAAAADPEAELPAALAPLAAAARPGSVSAGRQQ